MKTPSTQLLYARCAVATALVLVAPTTVLAQTPVAMASTSPKPAAATYSIRPIDDADFHDNGAPSPAKVALGRVLFFDKILSGNKNISCATCHHPRHASGDGVALAFGEGASALGPKRAARADAPVLGRVPRNAPGLFNLGAREFRTLFHDGRVERDDAHPGPGGFWTPAREQLPDGPDSVLAAQAMFPVLSPVEMAGHKGENEVADAVAADRLAGRGGAWDLLAARLRRIPAYVRMFKAAFTTIDTADEINFVHAANAIAAFEAVGFRADKSPFDRYLRTRDRAALGTVAGRGMDLFYGKAGCASCHAGPLQTDHEFHAIAMPQIGPGKGDGADASYWQATGFAASLEDRGRYRVSFDPADLFRFRTPSLRNVALTGPWGHAGAYDSLEAVVRHHLDPVVSLDAYSYDAAALPAPAAVIAARGDGDALRFEPINPARRDDFAKRDGWVQANPNLRGAIASANELPSRALDDSEVDDLVAFLEALTDPTSRNLDHLIPAVVPSGLPVAD